MIFLVTKIYNDTGRDYTCMWSLHKTEQGQPADMMARSAETWPSERQARASVNAVKKALSKGARFIKVETREVRQAPPPPARQAWNDDCQECEGDEDLCDGSECQK